MGEPYRYVNDEEDSARWTGFPFRDGDIVISTRSKTGTTWVQMICALLVFQTPELPEPVARLSPWLDQVTRPREEVYARLEAQQHRRLIKTHTPLDGIALDPRARYIVTGRHPLDMRRLALSPGQQHRPREAAGADRRARADRTAEAAQAVA